MQTNLASKVRDTELGKQADAILRRCVHCGFCSATCPTYQVLGDELDSPRGRIYLIKQMLEGAEPSRATQQHLDRCLTCRNCETTCPSGVQYGHLLDIGRQLVEEKVARPLTQRAGRSALRRGLNSPWFACAFKLGQLLRAYLPASLRGKLQAVRDAGSLPTGHAAHPRKVLLLAGCVQPTMMPRIDAATSRVLDAIGISTMVAQGSGCCGAINFHLNDSRAALNQMRANIDAWWPLIDSGQAEAIVMNASGCGAMVKEYAHYLRDDPRYAERARQLVSHVRDVAEIVAPHATQLAARLDRGGLTQRVAFHPPCTLQHWQKLRGQTEKLLVDLGFALQPFADSHLCCGSAGAYSVLQAKLSGQLRERKLSAMSAVRPDLILSSNMGCIGHLQSGTEVPVRHWIEAVDDALTTG